MALRSKPRTLDVAIPGPERIPNTLWVIAHTEDPYELMAVPSILKYVKHAEHDNKFYAEFMWPLVRTGRMTKIEH